MLQMATELNRGVLETWLRIMNRIQEKNCAIEMGSTSYESVVKLKYLGTT